MHRNRPNNDYGNYPYLSSSTSSRNTHFQLNDSRSHTHQSSFSNTTPITTYNSPSFRQHYKPSTTISDLAEPLPVFNNPKLSKRYRSSPIPFPSTYIPPDLSRRTTIGDARLATANALRERLLIDIHHNINEIDQELYSLERRPTTPRFFPSRLSSISEKRQPSSNSNHTWPNRPKRVYEVIPRITSEIKKVSQHSTPNLNNQAVSQHLTPNLTNQAVLQHSTPNLTNQAVSQHSTPNLTNRAISQAFVGQYHYGPEIEEVEIAQDDPENSDMKYFVDEIPEFSSPETLSLDQFRCEQSAIPLNRALIFVPEYGDSNEIRHNETAADLHQNNPITTKAVQSPIVRSSQDFISSSKLNIQDFEELFQTAPQPKIEVPPPKAVKPEEHSEQTEADLVDTILSKPITHSRPLTRTEERHSPSPQALTNPKKNTAVDMNYFFSDFENAGEEDLISLNPSHFALPTGSEIYSDDSLSNISIKQSQTSLLNPHTTQQQQPEQRNIENNNGHGTETERKKIVATTKHIIPSTSKLPSKKILPISITDNRQTQVAEKKNNVNQNQRKTSTTIVDTNTIEQSSLEGLNNSSLQLHSFSPTPEQQTSLPNLNSSRQRSASLRHLSLNQPSYILSRNHSITAADLRRISPEKTEPILNTEQQTPVASHPNSALPVPLNSPDVRYIRPTASRSTTPERRTSISSPNLSIRSKSTDLLNFDTSSTDILQTDIEHDTPSPTVNFLSLEVNHPDNRQVQKRNQSPSPSSSISEQDNDQLKSISLPTIQTKKFKHCDLRLPGISPLRSDTSETNLTSVDREEPYNSPISPDHNNDQLKTPVSESELIIEDPSNHKEKHSSPIEDKLPLITASQQRSKLSLTVRRPKSNQEKSINNQKHTIGSSCIKKKKLPERHRRVLFSNHITHIPLEKDNPMESWRDRIDNILTKKHFFPDKYSHIKSRVNSFANFEYHPRKITVLPMKKSHPNETKKTKLKTHQTQPEQETPPVKKPKPQIFGRLSRLPDGQRKIFHEKLDWNVPSKLRSYSLENFHYKSRRNDSQLLHEKQKSHSESRLSEIARNTPHHQILAEATSLPTIPDVDVLNVQPKESKTETKTFDINSNSPKVQKSSLSNVSVDSKRSNKLIFDEKLAWRKKSKLKDAIWENINYHSKQSQVQIFHQPTHWNHQSKLQMTSSDNQAKLKHWSEYDLHQVTKKKALFSQYHNPEWNDIIPENILTDDRKLEENLPDQIQDESPANRPKWNSVSKTRSVNSFYNPKVLNSNYIRRGWDLELRRKRVHMLPPLKRKRNDDEMPQLAIEAPPSNEPLTVDYSYDQSVRTHEHRTSVDYPTQLSRRSSKVLAPLRAFPDIQLLSETPRSQRPVQQEWYDELSKSRSSHRMDMVRTRNNSSQESSGSIQQINTPRDLFTLRSSTRNSQNSVVSGSVLDSSIRTNRATELRLSRDMEEYHQHCHDPSQSMPMEIRNFRLKGTQLTVPTDASIRPLSNVNYRVSERVKNRRIYPWNHLHPNGTSSRNSSLVPITEFRHPSFESSTIEVPQSIREE